MSKNRSINFYPIIAKILFISSIFYLSVDMEISKYLWWSGAVLQLIFTFIIMSKWIRQNNFEIHHINPSWFIPVVGNMIAPIAGVRHFSAELSWWAYSFLLDALAIGTFSFQPSRKLSGG